VIIVDKYIPNEEVGLYFSAADVVVLPYISASQSGIIQIAYGFNRPVITTDVGGLPDVVEDGVTGFIVPARNSKALSDSIIRYFDGMYEKRFEENIKNMKNIYSWEKFVDLFGKFLIDRAS
jgi:glycosyltransferase involved in cell wall biosynthesis